MTGICWSLFQFNISLGWCFNSLSVLINRPQDIIILMVGGATYEEARHIAQINESAAGVRIVLGGTTVHNSNRYF